MISPSLCLLPSCVAVVLPISGVLNCKMSSRLPLGISHHMALLLALSPWQNVFLKRKTIFKCILNVIKHIQYVYCYTTCLWFSFKWVFCWNYYFFVCSADPTNPFKFEQFSVNADFVLLIWKDVFIPNVKNLLLSKQLRACLKKTTLFICIYHVYRYGKEIQSPQNNIWSTDEICCVCSGLITIKSSALGCTWLCFWVENTVCCLC